MNEIGVANWDHKPEGRTALRETRPTPSTLSSSSLSGWASSCYWSPKTTTGATRGRRRYSVSFLRAMTVSCGSFINTDPPVCSSAMVLRARRSSSCLSCAVEVDGAGVHSAMGVMMAARISARVMGVAAADPVQPVPELKPVQPFTSPRMSDYGIPLPQRLFFGPNDVGER